MDDSWHIPPPTSTWHLPSSVPSPVPPLPSPPPPLQVSANQMGLISRHGCHPFVGQGSNLQSPSTVQEPFVFHTLNLDYAKSRKTELGNSFLALLSGHSHHVPSELSQLPNTRPALSKLLVHNGGTVLNGANRGVPATGIPSLPENHGGNNKWNGDITSFVEPSTSSISTSTKAPALRNSLQAGTAYRQASSSTKPLPDQALQGTNTGLAVSSMSSNWPIVSSPGNTRQHHTLDIQTSDKLITEARSSASGQDPALFKGRPRVYCMNTFGELFVSDLGLLGILCFCHGLRMSVTKFCEHSGSSSINPGEAVRMENGMTVAHWRKMCFGNNAPDDCKGWDLSDVPSEKRGLVGFRGRNFPTLSKNPETVASVERLGGFGMPGEPWDKSLYANHIYTAGHSALRPLLNKDEDNVQQSRPEGHNNCSKGFTSLSQSPMPALSKNHTLHAVKESLGCMVPEAFCSTLNKAGQNATSCLVADSANLKDKFKNPSFSYPYSSTKKPFSHGYNVSGSSFPTKEFIATRDGSSNIDLRLGQPYQHTNTSASSFATAVNPLQFGALYNSQKAEVNLPLERSDYSGQMKKPRPSLQRSSFEAPSLSRGQSLQAGGSINAFNHSKPEEAAVNSTKNSLISLYLSQLNNEGNRSSQSTDIVYNNKHFVSRELDPISSKCTVPEHRSDINCGFERHGSLDGSELPNNVGRGKGLRLVDNESCHTVKANCTVHNKHITDNRAFTPSNGGYCLHNNCSVKDRHSVYFNLPSSIQQNGTDSRNSTECGKVPSHGNWGHCNYAVHSSINPVSCATALPGLLNSGTPSNPTLPGSNSPEPTSTLSPRKTIDLSQILMEEENKFLALKHAAELSKQKQPTVLLEMSPTNQKSCYRSPIHLHKNLSKDDLEVPEEFRQGTFCDIEQKASKFIVRSVYSCPNCCSDHGVKLLDAKPGARGQDECCSHIALTQRISQCSKEQDQFSLHHVRGAEGHPYSRLRRFSNNSSDCVKQMLNQTEQNPLFYGTCCCAVLSQCLTGYLSAHNCPSESLNNESACGTARVQHSAPACDKDNVFQDGNNIRLSPYECSKKHKVVKDKCQTGLWRDVPAKIIGHSDATSADRPARVLETSRIDVDQLPNSVSKEFDGTHKVFESANEQQMSNICSSSSAPAVTEISVEVNNANNCMTNNEDTKAAFNLVVDEGSEIEKCGSSDEALGSRECEEVDPVKPRCYLREHSFGDLIDELKLENLDKSRLKNQMPVVSACQENIKLVQPSKNVWKAEKIKKQVKTNKPDISLSKSPCCISHSKWDFSSSEGKKAPPKPDKLKQRKCIFPGRSSGVKRKRSALSSSKPLHLKTANQHNMLEFEKDQPVIDDQSHRTLIVSDEKEAMTLHPKDTFAGQEMNYLDTKKPPKFMSLSCIGNSPGHGSETVDKMVRPVVSGKSGIISNCGLSGRQKPAKIVPLSLILKRAKRCDIIEPGGTPKLLLISEIKRKHVNANNGCSSELSSSKLQHSNEDSSLVKGTKTDPKIVLVPGTDKGCCSEEDENVYKLSMIESEGVEGSNNVQRSAFLNESYTSQKKPRYREARRCSLSKLLGKDKHATKLFYAPNHGESNTSNLNEDGNKLKTYSSTATDNSLTGMEHQITKLSSRKIFTCILSTDMGSRKTSQDNLDCADELCQRNTRLCKACKCHPLSDSDAFCCVCGSSNKEDINCLLECNQCSIRVHQACYGVSKVPRSHWLCRPCKSSSQNIVCVLCGYEGGAMTRATKSRNIVKSLLKAWNVGTGNDSIKSVLSSESVKNEYVKPNLVDEEPKNNNPGLVTAVRLTCTEALPKAVLDMTLQNQNSTKGPLDGLPRICQVDNSITAGVLDPSVMQWVHMVCGLWTPGTRCPNVDTMSAFDVSGASAAGKNIVCSMCNRPGGSCIRCRVLNCSVHFHPWCGHQKGLLQSEIEGNDNEKVGFYGRCMLHATQNGFRGDNHSVNAEMESPRKEWTCARTEGFKGRKSEDGFKPNHRKSCNDSGGCIVSQEQINAWLHINGQKPCIRSIVKLPCSDIEYDFRKEYFRYKQSKAWKHLVVYKSGIHALGLYTSQLIAQGAMVVEYVGEIVSLRVADRREIEYQTSRRLQYKSACYFFRIDKEHIIDATHKGGIARFVNHSCLPNCAARVISVRNEKKVVFFAERDINPGEEVTYDYHFNREDEGQKIPCFCNSRNCRRYLN